MEVNGYLHATAALPPGEKAPGTHWTGGWVGPRGGMDNVDKRKISWPCRKSNPGRPASNPSLYQLSYPDSLEVKLFLSLIN
jgi:hypothetical protein